MKFYLPTLKHLVMQLAKLQIYTLNLTTTFWHCKKKSHYFWTGVYIAALVLCWLTCHPMFVLVHQKEIPPDMCGHSLHMSRPSYWSFPVVFTQTHWWYSDFDSALCPHWSILSTMHCSMFHTFSILQQGIGENFVPTCLLDTAFWWFVVFIIIWY